MKAAGGPLSTETNSERRTNFTSDLIIIDLRAVLKANDLLFQRHGSATKHVNGRGNHLRNRGA